MFKQEKTKNLPNGTIQFETPSGKYALITKAANFEKASKKAAKYGGYLAEVTSSEENQQIFDAITGQLSSSQHKNTIAPDGGGTPYVWLGGTDEKSEGNWIWLNSGLPIDTKLAEWGSGSLGKEPDNDGGNQNYLALGLMNWPSGFPNGEGFGDAGSWNDLQGTNKLFYVVEF